MALGRTKCKRPGCKVFFRSKGRGRPAQFCSNACKQAYYRRKLAKGG